MGSQVVHISRIEPHPENARRDLGDLAELAASIRAVGLLQPLLVCAHPWRPGGYQLLDGHRRHGAAKLARLDMVPVLVRAVPDEAQAIMLATDLGHVSYSPADRAEAMGKLIDSGWTPARISRETGLHPSTVSSCLALLDVDQATRDRVRAGTVPAAAAVAAVRQTRARNRSAQGQPPRKASVAAEYFSAAHPLAARARDRCAGHPGRKYGGACGSCWEAVIRADAAANAIAAAIVAGRP